MMRNGNQGNDTDDGDDGDDENENVDVDRDCILLVLDYHDSYTHKLTHVAHYSLQLQLLLLRSRRLAELSS